MPSSESTAKTRNWYKVATIVLSAAMVIIMFMSGIYYKQTDDKRRRQEKIEDKLDKLHQSKAKLQAVPKVEFVLLTLEQSGLPESAFRSLQELPAVIRIEHVGGSTARGISVEIESRADILNYIPETSVEESSHTISDDRHRLRLEIPQLRRGSVIQGTIMCARIGPLSHRVRIDVGIMVNHERQSDSGAALHYLIMSDIDRIDPTAIASVSEADAIIENLRMVQRFERNESNLDNFSSKFVVILPFLISFLIPLSIVLPVYFRKSKKGKELGNKIGKCIKDDSISSGMTKGEVVSLLGSPRNITIVKNNTGDRENWSYEPLASIFFGWQPDAYIEFEDSRVIAVKYKEYGKRTY